MWFVLVILVLGFEVSAQRKKKDVSPIDVTQLSEDIALKAESTLIEAEKEMILENYAKAYDLFQVALGLNPNNPTIHFKIAEVLSKNGESRQAVSYIKKAIELDRKNKYFHVLAAEIYKSISEYDLALKEYEFLVDNYPGSSSYLFDIAIIYQFQGKNQRALATYERAEEIFGLNEFVLREKQKIYLKERNYEALISDWDELIAAYPDNKDYTIELCEFLLQRNRVDEAKQRLEKLLVEEPDNMKAELLLSQISLRSGDLDKAIRLAENTLADSAFNYKAKFQLLNALVNLAVDSGKVEKVKDLSISLANQYTDQYEVQAFVGDLLFKMGEESAAVDYYLAALKIEQSDFKVWQNILNIEMRMEAYDRVVQHADAAMEYFPNQAILYFFSGTANQMIGNYQEAVNVLETGKKYALEENLIVLFQGQLGDSYNSLQMYEKSEIAYETALQYDPENSHVLNNYSYFLSLRSSNLDKALKMSAKLVELYPQEATFLDTHGWVLYTMGDYDKALIFLEKAAGLKEDGTIIEHLGDVLFRLGRVDEAVKQWERASKLDDASENIDKKILDRKLYE
tara:strand:+ start:3058 stop:4767 length:1710 start_codon:yes stop_codon:yes gene_type:complete